MTKQDDGLFLLEVLIDKIVFVKSPCFSDKDFRTCVSIQCPAVEPLEICDDDPGSCVAQSGGPFVKTFNNGKSCLFSLKESDIGAAMNKFPVTVSVYKSLPCGCLPTKIVLGEATIDMTKEFVQARKKFLEDPNNVSYQALKDSFRIVGSDGNETGEIIMFLRISCFGKLIITRFQGSSGSPHLGAGGSSGIVDRSCNPPRQFQTKQDPCVCGAARESKTVTGQPCTGQSGGGGQGVCPIAQNPYNTVPCEEPDDPCYCSGPKPPLKSQLACRNTDKYCLHVPKGTMLSLPFRQDFTEEKMKYDLKSTSNDMDQLHIYNNLTDTINGGQQQMQNRDLLLYDNYFQYFMNDIKASAVPKSNALTDLGSMSSICTLKSKKRRVSLSENVDYASEIKSETFFYSLSDNVKTSDSLFGKNETTVYMTLYTDLCRNRTFGTQATASINKCLQVNCNLVQKNSNSLTSPEISTKWIPSTIYSLEFEKNIAQNHRSQHVYFWGKKKTDSDSNRSGMGNAIPSRSFTKTTAAQMQKQRSRGSTSTQAAAENSSSGVQTKNVKGTSAATATGRNVSIDEKCPATTTTKGDLVATVSHIKIGPKEPCPVHGNEPCQGPSCMLAVQKQENGPVKVTTASNPRRGVFELIIRRMTGAPLAKNELMLEWTPPPNRPPSCVTPCVTTCSPYGPCPPAKCKMIVCRSTPCKPKCCRKPCKKPCGTKPCGAKPCLPNPCSRPCGRFCGRPCGRTCGQLCGRPCGRPCVRPCGPRPIAPNPCHTKQPCYKKSCRPCSQPCPPPKCDPCPPSRCSPCQSPCPTSRCSPCPQSPCVSCPAPQSSPCPSAPRCGPCPSTRCSPCQPKTCKPACTIPCCKHFCRSPCKSSPCLRPCPVGRKRPRKVRSQPKIKAHRKRISPCLNRAKICRVVRCRSVPGPWLSCCPPPICRPKNCKSSCVTSC